MVEWINRPAFKRKLATMKKNREIKINKTERRPTWLFVVAGGVKEALKFRLVTLFNISKFADLLGLIGVLSACWLDLGPKLTSLLGLALC